MNFKEALEKLVALKQDQYCSLKYEVSVLLGTIEQECTIYTQGCGHITAETWEMAFGKLAEESKPTELMTDSIDPITPLPGKDGQDE